MNDSIQMPLTQHTAVSKEQGTCHHDSPGETGKQFLHGYVVRQWPKMEEYRPYWAKYSLIKNDLHINVLTILPHVLNVMNLFWGSRG